MASRRRRMGKYRRSRNGKAGRAGRLVGLGSTAGAFLALGLTPLATAPRAHADVEDIFQPVIDAIAQAVNVMDPSLASSLDPGIDAGGSAAPALAAAAVENATVPLTVYNTDPVVDVSIGGGPDIPVIADTGSVGVMVPWYDVGLQNLLNLGSTHLTLETTGYGSSPAGPSIEILYVQDPNTAVDFGNGIVTSPTTVDLALFAYPASPSNYLNLTDWSLQAYDSVHNADGFLGIGNPELGEVGPLATSPITALPGDLNEGVLINEAGGYLEFGPNPLSVYTSLPGAPIADGLEVSVGGGGFAPVELTTIDSGGGDGTIPADILVGNPTVGETLSPGTEISVYTSHGEFLYSYTTSAAHSPTISSDPIMNTGWAPFQAYPVYISYSPTGIGTTVFDY
jgi:hypothetical protein